MTSPLNYQGGRQFPQSILDDLDRRLKMLESIGKPANVAQGVEAWEMDWPEYSYDGMGCGLEDRNITDRYDAMKYGWDEALERVGQILERGGPLYAAPPARTALTDDAHWINASKDVPSDEREVIVFLNGHCGLLDDEARKGGGWGVRLGFYDHDKRAWYVHGQRERFVTHWQDEPISPRTAAQSASGDAK